MKKALFYIAFLNLLCSCWHNNNTSQQSLDSLVTKDSNKYPSDSVSNNKSRIASVTPESNSFTKIDSNSYSFSLYDGDEGSEGNEGIAYYKDNEIKKITLTLFAEMGQDKITYTFLKDNKILLSEKDFSYPKGIDSVKTDKDMHLDTSFCFSIRYDGNKIDNSGHDSTINAIDIISELRKTVPFKLGDVAKKNISQQKS